MINPDLLKNDLSATAEKLQKLRNFKLDVATMEQLESARKELQVQCESISARRNEQAKSIGQAKARGEDIAPLLAQVENLGSEYDQAKAKLEQVLTAIKEIVLTIPNIPADEVPLGKDENDNLEVSRFGEIPKFDFKVKDHVSLGEDLAQIDFALGVKLTGTRFVVLKKEIARLHRALTQFMLDLHLENGYEEVYVPYLVNHASLYGTGQLPKFGEDLFHTKPLEGQVPFALIPTAEVPVTNMLRDEIVEQDILPLRYCAHTPCFRSEAGSYGRDTRGLIRMHQFDKVELVHIVAPESSMQELEKLTAQAELVLQKLELPYRKVLLCTGDMGFGSAKTYDLEVWVPSQNCYREISSCSNMQDFQTRRMSARFKAKGEKKPRLLHSLNGSALAVGRTLVAVLENYQNVDGSINIPQVLQAYMGGKTKIG